MAKKSSFSRIDENVFLTMGVVVLLSLVILGSRYITRTECKPVTVMTAVEGPYFTGTAVIFKAAKGAVTYEWDFGDGSPAVKNAGFYVTHTYKEDKKYTVTLLVNGSCSAEPLEIDVHERPVVKVVPHALSTFTGPSEVYTDREITFVDTAADHTSWQWYVQGEPDIQSFSGKLVYTFTKDIPTQVSVRINGDDNQILQKTIVVVKDRAKEDDERIARQARPNSGEPRIVTIPEKPKEEPLKPVRDQPVASEIKKEPVPEQNQYPAITSETFGDLLEKFKDSKVTSSEFDQYFCGPVNVNYKEKLISFSDFLGEIKGNRKKIKNIEVRLIKNSNNCVKEIIATMKTKRRLF